MTTVRQREDGFDREALVDALGLLKEHYEDGGVLESEAVRSAKMIVASSVTAWAMTQLVLRLIAEGHVVKDSTEEVAERAFNMQNGLGFRTNSEVAGEPDEPPPQPKRSRKTKEKPPKGELSVDDIDQLLS